MQCTHFAINFTSLTLSQNAAVVENLLANTTPVVALFVWLFDGTTAVRSGSITECNRVHGGKHMQNQTLAIRKEHDSSQFTYIYLFIYICIHAFECVCKGAALNEQITAWFTCLPLFTWPAPMMKTTTSSTLVWYACTYVFAYICLYVSIFARKCLWMLFTILTTSSLRSQCYCNYWQSCPSRHWLQFCNCFAVIANICLYVNTKWYHWQLMRY